MTSKLLYNELKRKQNLREAKRSALKNKIKLVAANTNNSSKIVFPAYHIPKNNEQLRHGIPYVYNGFLIYLPGMVLAVDPGADFMYRLALSNIFIADINTIFVSHSHIDHAISTDMLVDWLIRKGAPVQLLAPQSVIDDGSVSKYHAGLVTNANGWKGFQYLTVIDKAGTFPIDSNQSKLNAIELYHGTSCYGFSIPFKNNVITYISDTGYAQEFETTAGIYEIGTEDYSGKITQVTERIEHIKNDITDSTILIVNVENFLYEKNSKTHLTAFDVIDMVKGSEIKQIILAHCNPFELSYKSWSEKLADFIFAETGINTIAPSNSGLNYAILPHD